MSENRFDNVAMRVRGNRAIVWRVCPPFRTAYWRELDSVAAQVGLPGLSPDLLLLSRDVQAQLLQGLADKAPEAAEFRPARIGFATQPLEVRRREEFRARYRLVKFLGKCSREVVLGALEIVRAQMSATALWSGLK